MEFENYPQPPIQEAILDIFVTLPVEANIESMRDFAKAIAPGFPDQKPRYQFASNIKFNLEDASQSSADAVTSQLGWIFRSVEKERAVQARVDGFTFNRMPVYDGWDNFAKEAKKLWEIYRKIAAPEFVTSIALRYINRMLIPLPLKDFREYCLLFPEFPKGIPNQLNEFLLRFGGPSKTEVGGTSVVTVTFQPPPPNKAVLPLIIDVHVTKPFPSLPARDEDQIWKAFELLRIEKNLVFEASITDTARKLFRK